LNIEQQKGSSMQQATARYYKRDFWIQENLRYVQPHYRMEKAARLVNQVARGQECEFLDVGCGPATLMRLLDKNIDYYGIDLAIHQPAPNLVQADFLETPIAFGNKRFDIILAQGVFEYVGCHQRQKFDDISRILKDDGRFIVSYVNFNHRNKQIYWPYSNVQLVDEFHNSLASFFNIERYFPTSHRWFHDEPKGRLMRAIQMHINMNIPVISRLFGVEYFFICSKKQP
jgi:SAM-dependent methyltransferase